MLIKFNLHDSAGGTRVAVESTRVVLVEDTPADTAGTILHLDTGSSTTVRQSYNTVLRRLATAEAQLITIAGDVISGDSGADDAEES